MSSNGRPRELPPFSPDYRASGVLLHVTYTDTHDNNTTRGWYEDLPASPRQEMWRSLNRQPGSEDQASPALVRLAWSSKAALAMAPVQDLLNLRREARMNVPGSPLGNWNWRCTEDMISAPAIQWLRDLTESSNRFSSARSPKLCEVTP
jgi:4-alpha-glucanotransferase